MSSPSTDAEPRSPGREIVQPFIDLVRAPRALWGVNVGYLLEGMVYFGMLGYLAIHFSDHVFGGMDHADELSHQSVMVLTAGITIAMFFLGFVADRAGVRFALIAAFVLLLAGRILISAAPTALGLEPAGKWSPLHLTTMAGIVLVLIGYGMYQPAAYAAVRKFTSPRSAAMGFAMLYALMNLGGWLPSFAFLVRDDDFLGLGITGTFWVYTAFTVVGLVWTVWMLDARTVREAEAQAARETAELKGQGDAGEGETAEGAERQAAPPDARYPRAHMHVFVVLSLAGLWFRFPGSTSHVVLGVVGLTWVALSLIPVTGRFIARHPLSDAKFFFFIFALIPVQTLFTYNWLVLPQYISRAYEGWVGEYFEIAANSNPLLIFFAVPVATALTQRFKVYNLMIYGTLIMAAPAFLLVIGPHWWTLFPYILIMTVGEALWQPRFLQYAAEIAPEGRTGEYMGVAQLPWFLTKLLVPWLYSGWIMERYCPAEGPRDTETMWLIFAVIAMSSTVLLLLAKGWLGKDFKTRA